MASLLSGGENITFILQASTLFFTKYRLHLDPGKMAGKLVAHSRNNIAQVVCMPMTAAVSKSAPNK